MKNIGVTACISIISTVVAISIISYITSAGTPPQSGGWIEGDWIVSSSENYVDVTIHLANGSLIVKNGGTLTLKNVTLILHTSSEGANGIKVEKGGKIDFYNCTIYSGNNLNYTFEIYGSASLNKSTILNTWGDLSSWRGGIQIYSTNVKIDQCKISLGKIGGIYIKDSSPKILRSFILKNGGISKNYTYGIYCDNSSAVIKGCDISNNTAYFLVYRYNYTTSWQYPSSSSYIYNGKYYYNSSWSRRWYRYLYTYNYNYTMFECYGIGIIVVNKSNVKIHDCTVEYNGASDAIYSRIYKRTTITDAVDYPLPGWRVYTYHYNYTFIGKSSVNNGNGIICKNSTVEINKTTIYKNSGTEGTRASYGNTTNNGEEIIIYKGTLNITSSNIAGSYGIKCEDSALNIKDSTIKIALKYMSGTSEHKKLHSIFVKNSKINCYDVKISMEMSASYTSSRGLIHAGMCGIWSFNSQIYIISSSISFSQDEMYADKEKCYGISVYHSNLSIEKLKISMKHKSGMHKNALYGMYSSESLMKVKNSSISYSFSGSWRGSDNSYSLYMASESTLLAYNLSLLGSDKDWSHGFREDGSSVATLEKCTFSTYDIVCEIFDYSSLTSNSSSFLSSKTASLYIFRMSNCNLISSKVLSDEYSGGTGIIIYSSNLLAINSFIHGVCDLTLSDGAHVNMTNTSIDIRNIRVLDDKSSLYIWWYVSVSAHWQHTGDEVKNASLTIKDSNLYTVVELEFTGCSDRFPILQAEISNGNIFSYTPHILTVSKGRVSVSTSEIINSSIHIDLTLEDNIPPEIKIVFPEPGGVVLSSEFCVEGKVIECEGEVIYLTASIDMKSWLILKYTNSTWKFFASESDGEHTLYVRAEDDAGNTVEYTCRFLISSHKPFLHIISPENGTYTNKKNITIIGEVDENASLRINGKIIEHDGRFSCTYLLVEGNNIFIINASDIYGRYEEIAIVVIRKSTSPTLHIEGIENEMCTRTNPLYIHGTTDGEFVYINGEMKNVINGEFRGYVFLKPGRNEIVICAVDRAGNDVTAVYTVYLDTSPPYLVITSPTDLLWTNKMYVSVSGYTEEGSFVRVNGNPVILHGNFFTIDYKLSYGKNVITVISEDDAGNTAVKSIVVYMKNTMPTLIVYMKDHIYTNMDMVTINGTTDWGCKVYVNDKEVPTIDFNFSVNVRLDYGKNIIDVKVIDICGNIALKKIIVIRDNNEPQIALRLDDKVINVNYYLITGKTEPHSKVIINGEIEVYADNNGNFNAWIDLEPGINSVKVISIDKAGNRMAIIGEIECVFEKEEKEVSNDILTLAGILIGVGFGLPIASYLLRKDLQRRREMLPMEEE